MTKERILIVDHETKSFEGVETLAERAGLEACYATNAEEAWSFLMDGGVSLLLINPSIPGVNGYILASMAKDLYPDVTAVMMTERVRQLCAARPGSSKISQPELVLEGLAPKGSEKASAGAGVVDRFTSC